MLHVSRNFQEKILAPERRVQGKAEIRYRLNKSELSYDDPPLAYTGTWTEGIAGVGGVSGTPVFFATEAGTAVEFEFYGTTVYLKTFTWMSDRGVAQCYIDGEQASRLDLGFGGNLLLIKARMHEEKLERGWHTAKVVCTGESGEFSGGTRIDIIGFEIEDDITETYTGDNLFLIDILEEREDVESGSIPVGNITASEIDIKLDNSTRKFDYANTNSPLHGLMKKNLRVRAWLGIDDEWVPLGVFYTLSWDTPETELYCHVTARDRLEQLRETEYTTSKAIVAPPMLSKPEFVRGTSAYLDDGRQVAAGVPRYDQEGILLEAEAANLIPVANQKFVGWTAYQGATVTLTQNQSMPEWNTTTATRIKTSGGTSATKCYLSILSPSVNGQVYSYQIKIKNIGAKTVNVSNNLPGSARAVNPGEIKMIKVAATGNGTSAVQLLFIVNNVSDSLDLIAYQPQVEEGPCTTYYPTTRAGEGLKLPAAGMLDNQQGTVEFDLLVNGSYRHTKEMCLFSFASSFFQGNPFAPLNSIRLYRLSGSTFYLRSNSYFSAGMWSQGTAEDTLSDGWQRFAIRWDKCEIALFIDGVRVISVSDPLLPIYMHQHSSVGCLYYFNETSGYYDYQCNTHIGAIRYSMVARSDELLAAQNTLEADGQTTFFMGFDGDLSVQPTGTSLYALAENVLQDAGLKQGEYWIGTELRDYLVPCAYFDATKHREALRQIAEAGLAVVYTDRAAGRIRVEIPETPLLDTQTETLFVQGGSFPAEYSTIEAYGIGKDDYFTRKPVEAPIRNSISVTTQPLQPLEFQEVYRSEEITLKPGEETSFTAFFDKSPVFGAVPEVTSIYQVDIVSATYYAWGMNIKIKNNHTAADTFEFVVKAYPLEVKSKQVVTAKDEDSIAENGLMEYSLPENPLIQTADVARQIADTLLGTYAPARRDAELDWRGDPALELGDVVMAPEFQRGGLDIRGYYVIVQQDLEWDGGLRAKLVGRRIADAE